MASRSRSLPRAEGTPSTGERTPRRGRALRVALALCVAGVSGAGAAAWVWLQRRPVAAFAPVGVAQVVVLKPLVVVPPPVEKTAGGRLAVSCNVPCTISVDATLIGKGPVEVDPLKPGRYRVDAVAETPRGRGRKSQTVDVQPRALTQVAIELRDGKLTLTTKPSAEVSIDGVSFGRTPLKGRPVIEGEHELVLQDRKRHLKLSRTVVVKAGAVTELELKLKW